MQEVRSPPYLQLYDKLSSNVIHYIPEVGWRSTGGTGMSQPTTAVSLRISDEDLALLDLRVGTAGARNRSDVVRMAIQEFLHNQPQIQDMQSVRIPVGRHDLSQLAKLYELRGVTLEQAAQEGLSLYIQKVTNEILASNNALDAVLDQAREETIRRSEYQA